MASATQTSTSTNNMVQDNPSFVLESPQKTTYENRPIPSLSAHDALIAVKFTGICGSDVHYWHEGACGAFVLHSPMVLGHESSGVVAAVGSAVTSVKAGDNVAVEPGIPCRRCSRCKEGNYNLCKDTVFAATPPYDGTLARYYKVPADFCYKLPSNVSLEEGALIEPLSVAVHIVRLAPVAPGMDVVVYGAGPVGLLCMAVARAFGANRIIAVDVNDARMKFAREYAATATFKPDVSEEPAESAQRLKTECGLDEGAHVSIEASGAEICARQAAHVLGAKGVYVQGGLGKPLFGGWPIAEMMGKEVVVKTSFRYKQGDYDLAVKLVAGGRVDVKTLVTGVVAFEEAEKAFGDTRAAKGVKTLIRGPE